MTKSEAVSVETWNKTRGSHEVVVTVRQVQDGNKIEYSGKRSFQKRTITINRVWHVLLDGEVIGSVGYKMFTREQRTPGRMYVNYRWKSPGWQSSCHKIDSIYGGDWGRSEAYSKSDAIRRIVDNYAREQS